MGVDICIVTIPRRFRAYEFSAANRVPEALGRLQAVVNQAGFSCAIKDLSVTYFRKAFLKQSIYKELEQWMYDNRTCPDESSKLSAESQEFWENQIIEMWVEDIIASNPKWLGVSLFADECAVACYYLCKKIREKAPHIKILLGGLAVGTGIGRRDNYGELAGDYFKRLDLCDDFISGEGDITLPLFLKNPNINFPGINNYKPIQINNLDELPIPDYKGLDLSIYKLPDPEDLNTPLYPVMTLSSSRGCVRDCNFCEAKYFHEKYKWHSSDRIVEEVIHYYERYNTTEFLFNDLLINAQTNRLERILIGLIDYQEKHNISFSLSAMFIVKPEKSFPEKLFYLMRKAGFKTADYGIETGSQRLRDLMNKKFNDNDLEYTLKMCAKYDIEAGCMLIAGYPQETDADFQETLKMLDKFSPRNGYPSWEWFMIQPFIIGSISDVNQTPEDYGIHLWRKDAPLEDWQSDLCSNQIANKRVQMFYEHLTVAGYHDRRTHENSIRSSLGQVSVAELAIRGVQA